jgi:hypothetical protein
MSFEPTKRLGFAFRLEMHRGNRLAGSGQRREFSEIGDPPADGFCNGLPTWLARSSYRMVLPWFAVEAP